MKWMHSLDEGKRGRGAAAAVGPRPRATGPTAGRADHLRHARLSDDRARREDRPAHPSFGKSGIVDLKLEDDQEIDPITGDIGLHAAPIIAKDVVIIGAAHTDGRRRRAAQRQGLRSRLRRADREAALDLPHDSAPRRDGLRHLGEGLGEYTGNNGVWAQMSADEELGLVYPADRDADRRLLRRPSAREEPVQRQPRRAGSEDRQAQVALPVH